MDNTPLPAALCSCMELQSSLLVQTLQGVIDVRLLYSPHITATASSTRHYYLTLVMPPWIRSSEAYFTVPSKIPTFAKQTGIFKNHSLMLSE